MKEYDPSCFNIDHPQADEIRHRLRIAKDKAEGNHPFNEQDIATIQSVQLQYAHGFTTKSMRSDQETATSIARTRSKRTTKRTKSRVERPSTWTKTNGWPYRWNCSACKKAYPADCATVQCDGCNLMVSCSPALLLSCTPTHQLTQPLPNAGDRREEVRTRTRQTRQTGRLGRLGRLGQRRFDSR